MFAKLKMIITPLKIRGNYCCASSAAFIILMILVTSALVPSATHACSGCAVFYPWMHRFPTGDELEMATVDFVNNYHADKLKNNQEATITEMWYLKIENPGAGGQTNTYEVILCYKEEFNSNGEETASYHFTSISYCEDRGFYFWPYLMGSFAHEYEMDSYIEEYVIRQSQSSKVVERVVLKNLKFTSPQPQEPLFSGPKMFALTAIFIALNLVLVKFTLSSSKRKINTRRQR